MGATGDSSIVRLKTSFVKPLRSGTPLARQFPDVERITTRILLQPDGLVDLRCAGRCCSWTAGPRSVLVPPESRPSSTGSSPVTLPQRPERPTAPTTQIPIRSPDVPAPDPPPWLMIGGRSFHRPGPV